MEDIGPESDLMSGLSLYDTPLAATNMKGGSYQIVSLKALRSAGFVVNEVVTGKGIHYGVRPKSQQELVEWALSKDIQKSDPNNPNLAHPLSRLAQSAIRGKGNLKL